MRADLFGADRPTFTGCIAWRGLVPMAKVSANLAQVLGTNWLGPRGHVLHIGELINFISFLETTGRWKPGASPERSTSWRTIPAADTRTCRR